MAGIAIVIAVLGLGLWLCVKGRSAGAAAVFAGLLVLCVVSTPLGSGLPGVVASVMSVVDGAAAPVLADDHSGHDVDVDAGREGSGRSGSSGERAVGVDR
jgi:hypothetical protein